MPIEIVLGDNWFRFMSSTHVSARPIGADAMQVKGLYALGPTKFLSCCFYPFILKKS